MTGVEAFFALGGANLLFEVAFVILLFRFRRSVLFVIILAIPAVVFLFIVLGYGLLFGLYQYDLNLSQQTPHASQPVMSQPFIPSLLAIAVSLVGVLALLLVVVALAIPSRLIARIVDLSNIRMRQWGF